MRARTLPPDAQCTTVEVFEDRAAASGRRIPLAVVVLPATGSPAAADAVFFISGGPGQAATRSVAEVAEEHKATRHLRDIVFVDQRGTGGSNALPCVPFPATDIRLYLGEPGPEEVRRCRDTLSAKADLRLYSTELAVLDLEDVRRALGYERVTLDAGSYGTKVALRYLSRFPRRVRAAVLRAVNPPGFRIPLPFAAAGQAALDRLIDDCGRDGACRAAFPDLRGDLAKALARLDTGPVPVKVTNPATGKVEAATLDRRTFVARLHLLLFASRLANRIPLLLHTAARGDFSPFADLAAAFGKAIADQIDWGMQLSVLCTEDLPLISREEAEREARGTFLGPGLDLRCAGPVRGLAARDAAAGPRGTGAVRRPRPADLRRSRPRHPGSIRGGRGTDAVALPPRRDPQRLPHGRGGLRERDRLRIHRCGRRRCARHIVRAGHPAAGMGSPVG